MTSPPPRLSRSMLFVPASRRDMIAKAARSEADAVCIDLEDAVAPDQKEASRGNVVRAFTELDFGPRTRLVRINGLDTAYPAHRWHAVRHGIVAAARANGLRALDGPYAAFKDLAGFERACRTARALGFDGKQCIHPSQLPVANAAVAPRPNEG